jgi:hypothetical protein
MAFYNNRFRRGRFIFFPFIALALALVFGAIVMFLWNAILPDLIGVHRINYWQAIGLLLLCRILFGNFRRGGGPPGMMRGGAWREKWMQMSDEERQKLKEDWKNKCGQKKN